MSYLTDTIVGFIAGSRACCTVQGADRIYTFKASTLTTELSRNQFYFISRMVKMKAHGFWVLLSGHGINASFLFNTMPLPSCCIMLCIWCGRIQEVYQVPSLLRHWSSTCLHKFSVPAITMRRRGIPRRGSNYGNREGRAYPAPLTVNPISTIPPSPLSLESEGARLNSSFQTSSFSFQSEVNRPIITFNFSVSVVEEEGNSSSSTPSANDPSQDDSILLGDLSGHVYRAGRQHEEHPAPDQLQPPNFAKENALVQDQCPHSTPTQIEGPSGDPSHGYSQILHLMTHPNGETVLDEEGGVTWIGSPSPERKEAPSSPNHVGSEQ